MKKASKNEGPAQAGEATAQGLTGKQQVFINAYLSNGFNATEAARLAGYKGNDQTLNAVGYENLRKPQIASVINQRMNECTASANEVMATLTAHMRGSIAKVLRAKGQSDLADDLEKDGADKIIKKLRVRRVLRTTKDGEEIEDVTEEFEIHDPQAAAVHVGKFHKLFTDKHEIGGEIAHTHQVVRVPPKAAKEKWSELQPQK